MAQTCFVIQGFGTKTDFATGRKLDLDASYDVIKEAVEAAGLECIRADEVQHSGLIDKPMYEMILEADLVIADLSTSNVNAVYELGVRHAVRPFPTIIVAEEQFTMAFDINRNLIRTYKHMGEDIGRKEAKRFIEELKSAIEAIMQDPDTDSPLYTFIPNLVAPQIETEMRMLRSTVADDDAAETPSEGVSDWIRSFREQKARSNWDQAISNLKRIIEVRPNEDYYVQQLALATYKKDQDSIASLEEARSILGSLDPDRTHDAETLGLWGAVHKRLYEMNPEHDEYLDTAILAYKRGFFFSKDYYNGINHAFLLNVRAKISDPANAIADWVEANRIRQEVVSICLKLVDEFEEETDEQENQYWVVATLWEAYLGLGEDNEAARWEAEATRLAGNEAWMLESTRNQIDKLTELLKESPLNRIAEQT